ncbi:MAG: T9SS type A sorting domain-containing protein [Candidatus Delongbacteria bacterium]|jgi:hypothetical protein|nr:T9SS type A sorting domain-containing protein [Candidatus Delongbacteria bacterium]MDD4205320.1 T9SS type A sorting domain-containing protein [Candidatus Delongbacteria bacterium]MDY0016425.1 T9SS type A sorting domain-containing protein [Candidatus Delongbacteria bacterium]
MKKLMFVGLILMAISIFASGSKVIVFGIVNYSAEEYTNETISNVTYKAWLQRIPGEVIEPSDGLAQCDVMMFPDPDSPLRGSCMVDLQHFSSWETGDVLYVLIRDYNTDKKWFYEAQAEYTIEDTTSNWVYLGFEDIGLEDSGMPWMLALPSGTESKTFTYPCVTTTGTDLNFVGIPVRNGWDKASDLDPLGTNIDAVSKWNATEQGWETCGYHPALGWITDLPVQTGDALMINAKNDFNFVVSGDSVVVQYNLITTSGTDMNAIVHPLTKQDITTASGIAENIGNCNLISKFNPETQQFESCAEAISIWVGDFVTQPGMPLLAGVTSGTVWPSGVKSENTSEAGNEKLAGAVPRVFYYHVTDEYGNDYDFAGTPYDSIEFECYIPLRPAEVIDQNSPGSGFSMLEGIYSVIYFNPANFPTPWQEGDELSIKVMDKSRYVPMYDEYASAFGSVSLDASAAPVIKGIEALIPGSGLALAISMPSGVEENNMPDLTVLHQNYPNPFNPETSISYSLPKEEQVTLSVFNMSGQLVKQLVNEKKSAGNHSVNFNASDLNSGIYYYTLETGNTKLSKKMLLVK